MAAVARIPGEHRRKDAKMFISFLRYLHAWWRYQNTVWDLSNLGDRELSDLGITRKEIPRVAWEYPYPEDRAKYRVR
jgi:uncharacterized protein YjiS (DUF1127 family)